MNKASFETKTCRDKRLKLASEDNNFLRRKKSTRFNTYEKSPSPSNTQKTLFARQKKQQETTMTIEYSPKPRKPKTTKLPKI